MIAKSPTVALLTDFGTEDGYVGAMKGQILTHCPNATLVDISHAIRPFDIRQGAFCLSNSYPYFPDKTVFVVVVDPGVGTSRRGLMVKTSQHFFVGPDNGVFSFVYHREGFQALEIQLTSFHDPVAPTFHGRDIFARIGAWQAAGKRLDNYLRPIKEPVTFLKPPHKVDAHTLELEIVHIDHFGNLILNFHQQDWMALGEVEQFQLQYQDLKFEQIYKTFGEVGKGEYCLNWDSSGFLQIARNLGNAAEQLAAKVGDKAILRV